MKTAPVSTLQFSGYPLKVADAQPEKEMPLPDVVKHVSAEHFLVIKKNSVADVPENWDESWFSNYE